MAPIAHDFTGHHPDAVVHLTGAFGIDDEALDVVDRGAIDVAQANDDGDAAVVDVVAGRRPAADLISNLAGDVADVEPVAQQTLAIVLDQDFRGALSSEPEAHARHSRCPRHERNPDLLLGHAL